MANKRRCLTIRQRDPIDGHHPIELRLIRPGQPDLTAEARIAFALSETEQAELRWYLEDYLLAQGVEQVLVEQVEAMIRPCGALRRPRDLRRP